MKHLKSLLLTLICIALFNQINSQTKMDYAEAWEKVDRLLKDKGLPKSALSEVNKIYEQAKREKNNAQVIRSLIYLAEISVPLSDNGTIESIRKIELEIETEKAPVRNILQSVAAQMYWDYLQNNRWKLYDRKKTTGGVSGDPAVWTLEELHEKISTLFQSSLSDELLLQQTPVEKYEAIVVKGNTRKLRPVLFDILAHRALDYFENDERTITKPADAFTLNENAVFDPVADFVHHKFETSDTASLHFKALLIYQQLLSFHSNDNLPDALMDADLRRLQFVYRYAVMPGKDEVYRIALTHLVSQYDRLPVSAGANALLAAHYFELGNGYNKTKDNPVVKNALKTAKQICETTIADFPNTKGAADCSQLLNSLLRKSLILQTEKVNIPGEPFRTLVEYQNFFTCYFRIIPVNSKLNDLWEKRYETDYWKHLVTQSALRTWKQDLPATDDYRNHSVEIKIDPLPSGEYILLGSVNPDFSTEENLLAAQLFYVSNISFVYNDDAYFALHRNTGLPLTGAKIQVWDSKYDYTDRKNKLQKAERITADQNGLFTLQRPDKNNRNVRLEISWKNDRLFMQDYQYLYTRYDATALNTSEQEMMQKNAIVFLFTDRKIYRPGQTVYFKGIAVTNNPIKRKAEIVTDKKVVLYLKDVNHQVLDSLTLPLNEYGSLHGQFRLPAQTLTGNFYIQTEGFNQSRQSFSVEEYKRPKFEVVVNKPEKSYIVNDTVKVTGTANAFAGYPVNSARVKYRVSRRARFAEPWYFFRTSMPRTVPMEITSGTTTTDANGNFSIHFNAIPDLTINRELNPVFDYSVEADVTDTNGETQSTTQIIQAGYQAVQLFVHLPQNGSVATDSLSSIGISSKNLNDEFESVEVHLNIYPLKDPGRLIRKRFWPAPDQFLYSKENFIQLFPNDEYKEEADYRNWQQEPGIYSATFSTTMDEKYPVPQLNLPPGNYAFEVTGKDRFGSKVKTIAYLQLFNQHNPGLPFVSYSWFSNTTPSVQPGQSTAFFSGSSAKDVFLIQQIVRPDENLSQSAGNASAPAGGDKYRFFSINNEVKTFRFSVNEDDRGGFGVQQFFVKHNRFYNINQTINVPWANKQLDIRFTTFRNKLQPGSQEKWEVKITGKNGEKTAAEMMATLYDASLDQFKVHQWQAPAIWPQYHPGIPWNGQQNFTVVQSQPQDAFTVKTIDFNTTYDRLIDAEFADPNAVVALGYAVQKRGTGDVLESAAARLPQEARNEESGDFSDHSEFLGHPQPMPENKAAIRKNFNETAFFYPDLKTDSNGNIAFSFTVPEALTQWKLMTLAHTPSLAFGYARQFAVTQKKLMVQPNTPRFMRENDNIALSAKIVNLSNEHIKGFAKLELFDASTLQPVNELFHHTLPVKEFSIAAGKSEPIAFQLTVPDHFTSPLLYRISAASTPDVNSPSYADGEENIVPVLSNRILVTETLPLNMRGAGTQSFTFDKLLRSGSAASSSVKNYALTLEYTANPAWYAVQALPYLTEYPYECAEQIFNRYYANSIAVHIANSTPRLKDIYNQWRSDSATSNNLVSNLEKNSELKSILLEETPWVLDAKSETEQKQQIARLFDILKMNSEASGNLNKLKEMQSPNGGFVWFKGGRDDRYITQYILTGAGHLQKLNMLTDESADSWNQLIDAALLYADERIKADYDNLIKHKSDLKKNNLSAIAVQYLYMRSFFGNRKIDASALKAFEYYRHQAKQYWTQQTIYLKAMIALYLHRSNDQTAAKEILASIKENAIVQEALGMFWKDNRAGYYWHEAPIETQSLLIEAFTEIAGDLQSVNEMKRWLLNQKQTQHWGNSKATAEACYALLLQGTDWLNNETEVQIKMGKKTFSSRGHTEAGTGYFKHQINAGEITPDMGNIQVTVSPGAIQSAEQAFSNGAVYWQYFEDLDKLKESDKNQASLKLKKQLFIEKQSNKGPVLQPVNPATILEVGDKLMIRIELKADREMEYVHLKDMRASGTEPVNVLSSFKWQGGLGYYESTKDVATHFFFNWIPKGTYVFEYPVFVTHKGRFSAGVATVQCMYAPEFISHSEGSSIKVQ